MLILTGQRRSEVADAKWSEFDMAQRLWTIPAERMKMSERTRITRSRYRGFMRLLKGLPRFTKATTCSDHIGAGR